MTPLHNLLIVLDVYNDFRDDPGHQPVEIRKAIALVTDPAATTIYLVGCGFEEYLHDSYSHYTTDAPVRRKQFIEKMEQRLQVFAASLNDLGFKTECRVHWTYPRYEQIAREAETLNADLVVQHVNDQKPHQRHNLSHNSWQLVKTCKRPLLLVKDSEWAPHPVVLAAVDPAHRHFKPAGLDHRILQTALTTAKALGGSLQVVHAYAKSALSLGPAGATRLAHREALDKLMSEFDIPEQAIHMIEDSPIFAIEQCHDELQTDIVVIGALSRSRLAEAIVGNTAEAVLDYVKSDLYIIRPE